MPQEQTPLSRDLSTRLLVCDRPCDTARVLRRALPRRRTALIATRNALAAASAERFRVLQLSIQADHLHLLVEADGPTGFAPGVHGLAIRVAKAMNRVLGRHGRVWSDPYHARLLRTPREVRSNALVYVLHNVRKHLGAARGLDPCFSARWFEGWRTVPQGLASGPSPVARARTWLARVGWRRHGLIDVDECPRATPHARSSACRSHLPNVAAASYVDWKKSSSVPSGSAACRTTSYGRMNSRRSAL